MIFKQAKIIIEAKLIFFTNKIFIFFSRKLILYFIFMDDILNYLNSLRRDYSGKELDIINSKDNPFEQFFIWLEEAIHSQVLDPNAMLLSTVDENNMPHSRVVLLREVKNNEFIFYTNYNSNKVKDIEKNNNVALNFYWAELDRQIRIEGRAKKTSEKLSDKYFKSRPRESKLSAIASPQSKVIKCRDELLRKFEEIKAIYENKEDIPRPAYWGGIAVQANKFEFWQGRAMRLHDRLVYIKKQNKWIKKILAP